MTANAMVEVKSGPHILVRILWYIVVGWWLTGLAMGLAWFLAVTIVGLPLSFWLVNRVPTILTLRPRAEQYLLVTGGDGVARYQRLETEQTSLLVRLAYFVVIGWWLSAFWMAVAWALMVTVLGIPIALMMVNRLPLVFSLHRGYA